jgi:type I restriction enzyme M protein
MKLTDVLNISKTSSSLSLFNAKTIRAVEAGLLEKNSKFYLKCPLRGKEIQVKPEEIVRQLWIQRLVLDYGYPLSRLAVEYPITFGRDTSKRADIVVFDADRPTVPYLIIEVKQPTAKGGKEQIKSYTHATGAPLALWSDGMQAIVWHRRNPNYFVEIPHIPTSAQIIDDIIGQPWTIQTLLDKEQEREKEGLWDAL